MTTPNTATVVEAEFYAPNQKQQPRLHLRSCNHLAETSYVKQTEECAGPS